MNKLLHLPFLLAFLIIVGFFIPHKTMADGCSDVPLSGEYAITASCAFAGAVNGVENGNLIIDSDQTLTINAGQTVVWNSGYSVIINGSIAINKGSPGGQLRKAYIYMKDEDDDGYPGLAQGMIVGTHPTDPPYEGYKRRSHSDFTSKFNYVSDLVYERCDGIASGQVGEGMTALSCSVGASCVNTAVLRMYATDNAHAGLPAQSAYSQIVCCSGGPGLATATSTAHEQPDVVLRLSGADNAHVEAKTQANYANPAILTISRTEGRILCKYDTSCSSPYTCLASISGDTNAHIGDCDTYSTKVCCANVCP